MFWTLVGYLIHTSNWCCVGSGQWTNHKYPTTCSSCSCLPSSHLLVKILMLLTIYVAFLQSTLPSLTLDSSTTTSMIPEPSSEPFVKRWHVRVLRASPCVSLSSFVNCVKTSMSAGVRIILLDLLPLRKQRASQSTISQAETERDANTKVELDRRNETMSDVYRAPSPLGVPSFACVALFVVAFFVAPPGLPLPIHHCLGRCSCDRRLLSSFPPRETQNKRLPRRSPCWRSHLDQRSRSTGEDIDKKGDSTFFGRG